MTNRFSSASVSPTFSLQNDENKHALSIVIHKRDDESLWPSENAITPLAKWKLFEKIPKGWEAIAKRENRDRNQDENSLQYLLLGNFVHSRLACALLVE